MTLSVNAGLLFVSGPPGGRHRRHGQPRRHADRHGLEHQRVARRRLCHLSRRSSDSAARGSMLTLAINDGGNAGAGGPRSASAATTIAITAVNDAPVRPCRAWRAPWRTRRSCSAPAAATDLDHRRGCRRCARWSPSASPTAWPLSPAPWSTFSSGDGFAGYHDLHRRAGEGQCRAQHRHVAPNAQFHNGLASLCLRDDEGERVGRRARRCRPHHHRDARRPCPRRDRHDDHLQRRTPTTFQLADFGFTTSTPATTTDVRIDTLSLPAGDAAALRSRRARRRGGDPRRRHRRRQPRLHAGGR